VLYSLGVRERSVAREDSGDSQVILIGDEKEPQYFRSAKLSRSTTTLYSDDRPRNLLSPRDWE